MMRTTVRVKAADRCFLEDIEACSGLVVGSICERHSKELFKIAWR